MSGENRLSHHSFNQVTEVTAVPLNPTNLYQESWLSKILEENPSAKEEKEDDLLWLLQSHNSSQQL